MAKLNAGILVIGGLALWALSGKKSPIAAAPPPPDVLAEPSPLESLNLPPEIEAVILPPQIIELPAAGNNPIRLLPLSALNSPGTEGDMVFISPHTVRAGENIELKVAWWFGGAQSEYMGSAGIWGSGREEIIAFWPKDDATVVYALNPLPGWYTGRAVTPPLPKGRWPVWAKIIIDPLAVPVSGHYGFGEFTGQEYVESFSGYRPGPTIIGVMDVL